MRISDWSSDVCSSDLGAGRTEFAMSLFGRSYGQGISGRARINGRPVRLSSVPQAIDAALARSEEHTSELQSLMRISYAVFCLKKKKKKTQPRQPNIIKHILTTNDITN